METVRDFICFGSKITANGDCSQEIKRCLLLGKKSYGQPRQHITKQRHYFVNKGLSSQSYGFSSSHVWMWELDYNESWVPKNWCFWIVVLEKTLESPLDCKEIQPVHPKGNQSWLFIGRTDTEAEAPILLSPDVKNWLLGKDPAAGKDWRWEEKGMTEDEMVGWHHWLSGDEFEQTLGDSEGQGSLACCSPWGCKESDMIEQWSNKQLLFINSLLAGEIKGVTISQFFYLSSTDSLLYKLRFPYTHLSRNCFEIHRRSISKVNQLISKPTSKNW